MAIHTTYISLYTGSAMLDEGFRQGLAGLGIPEPKPVCYVERDIEAGALLVDKILSGQLVQAPVWTDSDTFDCKPFVGKVDAIIGGFPCQPWSLAGTRKGSKDKRWLWDHIRRITEEVRPSFLFLENVSGLISGGGLNKILEDFITLGYDTEWISIRAAHVGAPHRRERVFILAKLDDSKHDGRTSSEEPKGAGQGILDGQEGQESTEQPTGPSERAAGACRMADSDHPGIPPSRHEDKRKGKKGAEKGKDRPLPQPTGQGSVMVNSDGERRRSESDREFSSEGIDFGRRPLPWPPRPTSPEWGQILSERPDLAPAQSEVRGVADGMAGRLGTLQRTGLLRLLGNGVVPQQAATALAILYERIINNESTS